ncbi:uncharacterized protein BX664DRAFT_88528 [Halteromyces radiatus]|uniref:uncharacterized protein n=1 Tax=Halteromyces radiatus TaxID=101107 RepID=UPI002220A3E3|nr:uncharacterized protein BX664DRAFT_88528 [Halteromyces radiatus]KAI8092487.1 hypothetical protein BX664DRAFT_88528 [Halteromyces radiatus]
MDQDVTIKELSNVDETSSTQEIIPPTRTEEQHKEVSPDTSLEPPSDDQEKQTTSSINPLDSKPLEQQQYINSPSSWQIPPSAFQQKQQQQQQPYEPTESLKSLEKTTSKRDRLEQRIKEDEEDLDAWFTLIADIQQSGDLEATRAIYERFLKIYPTSVSKMINK